MPGLNLYPSNRLEILTKKLAEVLNKPLASTIHDAKRMGEDHFLASDFCDYIREAMIEVNGGLFMG